MMNKGIILLSGGLDSVVSLAIEKENCGINLALTFDYGQKSAEKEIQASKKIAEFYGINHRIIKLDWLKEITKSSLVSSEEIPAGIQKNSNLLWVPNRNGLFLNIAASIADSEDYSFIIIGANKEEAASFPDNTKNFIMRINKTFKYSTKVHPKVIAPLINKNKNDIVKSALEYSIPLEMIYSCYTKSNKHCGKCESCIRLKNALASNHAEKYIEALFK